MVCEKEYIGGDVERGISYVTPLKLPAIPPTDEKSSNICKVRYILRVTAKETGCNPNTVVEIPITIGTYPINDDVANNTNTQSVAGPSTMPPTAPPISDAVEFVPLSPLSVNAPNLKPSAPCPPYPEDGEMTFAFVCMKNLLYSKIIPYFRSTNIRGSDLGQ